MLEQCVPAEYSHNTVLAEYGRYSHGYHQLIEILNVNDIHNEKIKITTGVFCCFNILLAYYQIMGGPYFIQYDDK